MVENEVSRTVSVPPDPSVQKVLTRANYELSAALAEIIDNSLDASAQNVRIRFIRTEQFLVGLQVIDDGVGIPPNELDSVMKFGRKRSYGRDDLGMYGVGLKTSSLSQADSLTVISKSKNAGPGARRWTRKGVEDSLLQVMRTSYASNIYNNIGGLDFSIGAHGTVVDWQNIDDFGKATNKVDAYLKRRILEVEQHIALIFHRVLDSKRAKISLDVVQDGKIVSIRNIAGINPFKYPKTGCQGFPKTFSIKVPGSGKPITGIAHIWPPRTKLKEYKIPRGGSRVNVTNSQGLYIYRNDRLLMAGGWGNARISEAHYALARMAIDLTLEDMRLLGIFYNKTGVLIPASFDDALKESFASDGTTFTKWIDRAQQIYRTRDPNKIERIDILMPGRGMKSEVREAFVKHTSGHGDQVDIEWKSLDNKIVFRIDRQRNILILNSRYRKAILQSAAPSGADAPLVKTLMVLLFKELFGERKTSRIKLLEKMYQNLLLTAIKVQQ